MCYDRAMMEKDNKTPIKENTINVDAVREYMLSEDPSILDEMERLKNNPNRVNLDNVL